jgi:ubiquinone/menaquinone biosynthesis C-methylase UbiE
MGYSGRIMEAQLNYGNWIRKKNLLILGLSTLVVGALFFIPLGPLYRLILTIMFILILFSFLFPLYAYMMFSQMGGRFQDNVYNFIIQSLGGNLRGRFIDIGSGNGVLAVKLAQQCNETEVIGIDYWGKDWEYSKNVCDLNARVAKVDSRVNFKKGNAAALEFSDDLFDGAISNLTFHEVKSIRDKRLVVQEALRVVKPGGSFAFVDYFFEKKYYGKALEFDSYLRELKLSQFECKPLRDMIAIPFLLRHPKILGRVGIIFGRK